MQLPSNRKSIVNEFITTIAGQFSGAIETSNAALKVGALDNSIYELKPQLILFPKKQSDIILVIKTISQQKFSSLSLTARGAATGTNAQSLNHGIILDTSRFYNKILDLDLAGSLVTVQAGVVLDQLNNYLEQFGYFFPVQISTANRATIGGMFNTDASGKGSRIYGKTKDNLHSVKLINYQGRCYNFTSGTKQQLLSQASDSWQATLIEKLISLNREHRQDFATSFPDIPRGLTGYNLPAVVASKGIINPLAILCGAEGTLGFISELTLKIKPRPKCKSLVVAGYADFLSAVSGAEEIIKFSPLAIETLDETTLKLALADRAWDEVAPFLTAVKPGQALNLIEFAADDQPTIKTRLKELERFFKDKLGQPGWPIFSHATDNPAQIAALWTVRSRGVGLLSSKQTNGRPIALVEDCAVAPKKLPAFIADFKRLLDVSGFAYGIYGHVDVGCIHVRPALNLLPVENEGLIRKLSDQTAALVLKYGGVFWGEHGKGVRGEYIDAYLTPGLKQAMRSIKTWFDPANQFNPGKLYLPLEANEASLYRIDDLPLRVQKDRLIAGNDYQAFNGVLRCDGNGECLSLNNSDLMCPSFKISRDKIQSPKGRAVLIRDWLLRFNHKQPAGGNNTHGSALTEFKHNNAPAAKFTAELYNALDSCLSCKACTSLCPVRIDIPEYKSRFLNWYYQKNPRPLRDFMVAYLELVLPFISRFAPAINFLLRPQLGGKLITRLLGLSDLPELAGKGTKALKIYHHPQPVRQTRLEPRSATTQALVSKITIVPDAFLYFYEPKILSAACSLLARLGYRVKLAKFHLVVRLFM